DLAQIFVVCEIDLILEAQSARLRQPRIVEAEEAWADLLEDEVGRPFAQLEQRIAPLEGLARDAPQLFALVQVECLRPDVEEAAQRTVRRQLSKVAALAQELARPIFVRRTAALQQPVHGILLLAEHLVRPAGL